MQTSHAYALVIDAPEFFEDPDFVEWLNSQGTPKFSWHEGGMPTNTSDVVVLVCPSLSGEGSDSDMPEHIWDQIMEECRRNFAPNSAPAGNHIMVWLKNI